MDREYRLECDITKIKNTLRTLIPNLIECCQYLRDYKQSIDAKNDPLNNEQIAKDQLILPVLKALGYKTEFDSSVLNAPKLEVWAETSLSDTNRTKVDYAIFPKDKFPRMIIEAKALSKGDQKRSDYASPQSQTLEYYKDYSNRILVAVLSNGERWSVFKREWDNDKQTYTLMNPKDKKDPNPANVDYFVLAPTEDADKSISLSNEEGLDKFVRLLSKPSLLFTLEKATSSSSKTAEIDSYDAYRSEIEQKIGLRKQISGFVALEEKLFLTTLDALFETLCKSVNIVWPEVTARTGSKKWEQETALRKEMQVYWKNIMIDIYHELKNGKSLIDSELDDDITTDDFKNYNLPVEQSEVGFELENENDSSEPCNNPYTDLEKEINKIIYDILVNSNSDVILNNKSLWSEDDCLKYFNAPQFIKFVVTKRTQNELNKLTRFSEKGQSFAVSYGNHSYSADADSLDTAQFDISKGAVGFNIANKDGKPNIDSLKELLSVLPYSLIEKGGLCSGAGADFGVYVTSKDDFNILCNVIIHCYELAIDRVVNS